MMAIVALLLAGGCSKDADLTVEGDEGQVPEEVTLTLTLPDYAVVDLGTRAPADVSISKLTVLCYDKNGTQLSNMEYTGGWNTTGSNITLTVPIHKQTSSLQFVTNASIPTGTDPTAVYTGNPDVSVLWGKANLSDLISKTGQQMVTMVRHNAKVKVENAASGFNVTGVGVYGTASQGSVAPKGGNPDATEPNIKNGEGYGYQSGIKAANAEINVFETPRDQTVNASAGKYTTRGRIIIRGRYNNVEGYYVVAFRTASGSGPSEVPGKYSYTPIDVLRNHLYRVQITEVRGQGFPTLNEALAAEPDNRITVQITDINPEVDDMIANRDYELGVSSEVNMTCDDTEAMITVVTSNPSANRLQIVSDDASWLKSEDYSIPAPTAADITAGGTKSGWKYVLRIPTDKNQLRTSRTGHVVVRSGELTREVTVNQGGRDYLRDQSRKVTMYMGGASFQTDYFKWVDESLKGVIPEDFQQVPAIARNMGLLFPAVPAYTVSYRIPRFSSDTGQSITGSGFSLNITATYYEITMTAGSAGISTGTFSLTNAQGIRIEYPLLRTGYLHEMKSSYNQHQPVGKAVEPGWYYYEVVKVKGMWMLDRNLGASSNKPYISTSAALRDNTGSLGAYLRVSNVKSSSISNPTTVVSSLGVSRFQIPTRDEIENLNVNVTNMGGYENIYIAGINTESPSQIGRVYLSHGGYYDGEDLKYDTHANLWTRTLVSGNQGFSQASPEFGLWYQYYNVYVTSLGFSNMRIANGSGGALPTSESIYKYMPLRLIWK